MTTRNINELRKLSELKKVLYANSLQDKITRDSTQFRLKEVYKPLLSGQESQLKETQKQTEVVQQQPIAEHQELIAEIKRQPLIIPLIKSLNIFPAVVDVIMGKSDGSALTGQEQRVLRELEHVDDRILRTLIQYYDLAGNTTESDIGAASVSESPSERELQRKPGNLSDDEYGEAVYTLYTTSATDEQIKHMSSTAKKALWAYLRKNHDVEVKASANPWRKINAVDPDFVSTLRKARISDAKHPHTGKGISIAQQSPFGTSIARQSRFGVKFLSSNPKELFNKLNILIAEKEAGNTNVLDEASAIVDELRRLGLLTISQIKKIYKLVN